MSGSSPPNVRLTLSQLRQARELRMSREHDDAMLSHIRKLLPALLAGVNEWTFQIGQDVIWLRWHWYFDEAQQAFVIPEHGMSTNVTLLNPHTGAELPSRALYRMALHRLHHWTGWQPMVRRRPKAKAPAPAPQPDPQPATMLAAMRANLQAPPIAPRPMHNDGTATWGNKVAHELALLPDEEQFARLAKLARQKFGFDQTLAFARAPDDPDRFVLEDNFSPAWKDLYGNEDFALIDPRLMLTGPPQVWDARDDPDHAFWQAALQHEAHAGWAMPSPDGWCTLVLARTGPPPTTAELARVGPNLAALAAVAHKLIRNRLLHSQPGIDGADQLTSRQLTILRMAVSGKRRKELLDLLGTSQSTVDRNIAKIKKRLGAASWPQAIAMAKRLGVKQD